VSERSGVGVVELSILAALDSLGARSEARHVGNARVLADVGERIGLAPGYSYEVLQDLARPWTAAVRLVDGRGNYGSRNGDPAGSFRYTTSRLSPAGEVVLAAERNELAPVPIGLINGDTNRQGTKPPFRPQGIIDAVREVMHRPGVANQELFSIIGPPDFLTGCDVTGDLTELAAGRPVVLQLHARVTVGEDRQSVTVDSLPPNVNRSELLVSLADRAIRHDWGMRYPELGSSTRIPIAEITDVGQQGNDRFLCVPEPGIPPEARLSRTRVPVGPWPDTG
jgi:DNA gyrase subunit A